MLKLDYSKDIIVKQYRKSVSKITGIYQMVQTSEISLILHEIIAQLVFPVTAEPGKHKMAQELVYSIGMDMYPVRYEGMRYEV